MSLTIVCTFVELIILVSGVSTFSDKMNLLSIEKLYIKMYTLGIL